LNYINLNGKLLPATQATLNIDNSLLRFGYGLFETLLVKDGTLQHAQAHMQRLFNAMAVLQMQPTAHFTPNYILDNITKTVTKNKLQNLCRVRLQIYAGSGSIFDFNTQPNLIIECFEISESIIALNQNGLICGLANGLEKSPNALSNFKTNNAMIYALAAKQAKAQQWNDALISNTQNHIIESCIANIFWIKNNQVFTPPLSSGCIAGVMRQFIINQLQQMGTPITEKNLTLTDLKSAHEVFLCNSIRRIKWVAHIPEIGNYKNNMTKIINTQIFQNA